MTQIIENQQINTNSFSTGEIVLPSLIKGCYYSAEQNGIFYPELILLDWSIDNKSNVFLMFHDQIKGGTILFNVKDLFISLFLKNL